MYNDDDCKRNEIRIKAVLSIIEKNHLAGSIVFLGGYIAFLASEIRPELALTIIGTGNKDWYPRYVAEGIAKSAASRSEIDRLALEIAKAYPGSADDVAEFHPHLRFEIAQAVPGSVGLLARRFPEDAMELAISFPARAEDIARALPQLDRQTAFKLVRLSPGCASYLAKRFPDLAPEIKEFLTLET